MSSGSEGRMRSTAIESQTGRKAGQLVDCKLTNTNVPTVSLTTARRAHSITHQPCVRVVPIGRRGSRDVRVGRDWRYGGDDGPET